MRLAVRVKPRSSRPRVGGRHGDALVVAVTQAAVDGKATAACLHAVANAFGVRSGEVSLVSGASSRSKLVEVTGRSEDDLQRVLSDLMGDPRRSDRPPREAGGVVD